MFSPQPGCPTLLLLLVLLVLLHSLGGAIASGENRYNSKVIGIAATIPVSYTHLTLPTIYSV